MTNKEQYWMIVVMKSIKDLSFRSVFLNFQQAAWCMIGNVWAYLSGVCLVEPVFKYMYIYYPAWILGYLRDSLGMVIV
jgi:hypothetical protein